jgi:hypothetical protein
VVRIRLDVRRAQAVLRLREHAGVDDGRLDVGVQQRPRERHLRRAGARRARDGLTSSATRSDASHFPRPLDYPFNIAGRLREEIVLCFQPGKHLDDSRIHRRLSF